MKEYSFLPTYKNGEILRCSDFYSFVRVVEYINKNNLSISDEPLHGFNENSGNVYITTDDNVSICSAFGRDPLFLVTIGGEEVEYETYLDAIAALDGAFIIK